LSPYVKKTEQNLRSQSVQKTTVYRTRVTVKYWQFAGTPGLAVYTHTVFFPVIDLKEN